MPATKQILTREDLDGALAQALGDALTQISERIGAEVREHLDGAVNEIKAEVSEIKEACEKSNAKPSNASGRGKLLGQSLSVSPSQSREVVVSPSPSDTRDGYAALADTDLSRESAKDKDNAMKSAYNNQYQSAAVKALQKFTKPKASDIVLGRDSVVAHPQFEQIVGALVALNCLALGIETNIACLNSGVMPASVAPLVEVIEFVFCVLFSAEIGMRISVHRCKFLIMEGWQWNIFDASIVSVQVLEQVMYLSGGIIHSAIMTRAIKVARLLRLFRILRIVRLLHLFTELHARIKSIIESLSSLLTTLALLVMLNYAFSVFFAQITMEANMEKEHMEMASFFGSLPRTSLTLLECIIGGLDWDHALRLLLDGVGIFAVIPFIFYISFSVFVILNVIMGVFIDKAIKVAQEETELEIAVGITGAFLGEQVYTGEDISWAVFEQKLSEPELQACFALLNISITDARCLFELIDTDKSGSVDAKEIVEGCLRLKGNAKALDMSLMLQMINGVTEQLEVHVEHMSQHVDRVDENLTNLCRKVGLKTRPTVRFPSKTSPISDGDDDD